MARRVSFSGDNLSLEQAVLHYNDTADALRLFFSAASPVYESRFVAYKPEEVRAEFAVRLAELDRSTTMNVLAAVEAAFRIDYLQRCYRRKRDGVSRRFLKIYREKQAYASLEDDIFEVWKRQTIGSARLIGELRGAFKFRHWMAHGRYWTPKLGRKYDCLSVYPLAFEALRSFPLLAY